jgi:hypothetical protein
MIHEKPVDLEVPDAAKPYLDGVGLDISAEDRM